MTLPPDIQKLVDERVLSGRYATSEDVVRAGLSLLQQTEQLGSFAPGELDAMLAEGEADIAAGNVVDADEFFAELRARYQQRASEK